MPRKSNILTATIPLKKPARPSRRLQSQATPEPRSELERSGLDAADELRLRAERRAQGRTSSKTSLRNEADAQRLLHELEVHQIELEMQNTELRTARDEAEAALEKYTDLYDFAPIGYFTIAASGIVQLVNLSGARMFGIDRSRLPGRVFRSFISEEYRPIFDIFLKQVFAGQTKQSCDVMLANRGQPQQAVNLAALRSPDGKECRVAVVDITERKRSEEAQRRIDVLAASNLKLEREIARRQAVEKALRKSEQHSRQLLEQSRHMQKQLQLLSRQLLSAQEEERKKISRELHDVVAQTLTTINVRLAALKKEAALNTKGLQKSIARTQQLVEHSVNIVHQFARELRPTVLDDLGLIPALHTFMTGFKQQTGIHVSLSAFAAIEQVHGDKRTALFRVAQEALTNVARHAQASRAEVIIQKLPGVICMKIKDNGKGLPEDRGLGRKPGNRLGLLGMGERLQMVGGNFTIQSVPGKGTTVVAQVPLIDRSNGGGGEKKPS